MIIRVRKKHIKAGKPKDCGRCPIALAIKEQAGYRALSVTGPFVQIARRKVYLPDEAKSFIRVFDAVHDGKPFAFELPIEKRTGSTLR